MADIIGGNAEPKGGLLRKLLVIFIPIGIILLSFVLVAIMMATKKEPEAKKRRNPTLAVTAVQAYTDTVVLDVSAQGQARPRTEIDLVPQVGGKIIYVSPQFVAGGVFTKGETLVRIEQADYRVAVVRAEAAVARAEQALIREQAESEIARRDWEELGQGTEPSDLTLRKPQMAEARANLQSAKADLDNANLQLNRTYIRAPFNGRIKERSADTGQFVGPGTRLARIFSTDIIEVPLSLTDADLTRLDMPLAYVAKDRADAPDVKLSAIIAGQRREWAAKLVRTDSSYNPQTRALSAIAEVRDPYGAGAADGNFPLAPGLFVDAEISGKTLASALVIPRDALRPEDKVYVVNNEGVASSRDATVLDTNSQIAVLSGGVERGEYVIVSPLEKSQLNLNFRVLDAKDPTKVIIEPPEPEEDEEDSAENEDGDKDNKKKRKKDKKDLKKKSDGKSSGETSNSAGGGE